MSTDDDDDHRSDVGVLRWREAFLRDALRRMCGARGICDRIEILQACEAFVRDHPAPFERRGAGRSPSPPDGPRSA